MSDSWDQLALYESRDLVARLFRERHSRDIAAEKAGELVAYLAQAREYFLSARRAGDLVSPLLTYYGVLALTRWLILFRSHNLRESGLAKRHGLSAVKWDEQLAQGLSEFVNTRVRVESGGTFAQLATVGG